MVKQTLMSELLALLLQRKNENEALKTRLSTLFFVVSAPLTELLSIVPRSNVPDPRRRPRTVLSYPSPSRRTHQHQRLNLSQCPRPRYHLRRVAHRATDVGAVVVADPPPRGKMRRPWTGWRAVASLPGRVTDDPGVVAHEPVVPGATQTRGIKRHAE